MTRALLVALAALALLGGCSHQVYSKTTLRATGWVEVPYYTGGQDACMGTGPDFDMHPGTRVLISDSTGNTVGVGHLGESQWTEGKCRLPFTVGAPAGLGFYGVEIAKRGRTQYAEVDLSQPVYLTLPGDGR